MPAIISFLGPSLKKKRYMGEEWNWGSVLGDYTETNASHGMGTLFVEARARIICVAFPLTR